MDEMSECDFQLDPRTNVSYTHGSMS